MVLFQTLISTLLAGLITAAASEDAMATKNQEPKTFKSTLKQRVELNYLLFVPEGDKKEEKKWPLILFLHGAGERGTNLSKVTVHGPPKIVKNRRDFPFIVISPQCPPGQTWSEEALLALLDHSIEKYPVDPKRVYLTGLSMGGYGTWSLGTKYPERFAAIAPICGGGNILPLLLPPPAKLAALKRLPVWAFHGAKDELVVLQETERMVNALKALGNAQVKLTVYPEAAHDSWTETYNNPQLYEWFLRHQQGGGSTR